MRIIKNWLTRKLLCAVVAEDVLSILQSKSGAVVKMFLGKEEMTANEARALLEEVKFLEKTRIWSIITNSLVEQAKMRMFEQSKCDADMMFGKAVLFTVDTQKKLLEKIKKYKNEADAQGDVPRAS